MNYAILIYLIGIANQLLVDHVCTCEQLQSQDDCNIGTAQCSWDGKSCSTIQCSTFDGKSEQECINFIGCAINDVGNCRPFSDCIDYHVTKPEDCKSKWANCEAGNNIVDGKYECQEKGDDNVYYVCSKITEQGKCTADEVDGTDILKQADGQVCDWIMENNEGKCIAYDTNKCSNIISKSKCDLYKCRWDTQEGKCSEPFCQEISDKQNCTYLRGDQTGTYQICQWKDEQCQDTDDTSFLTKENCLKNTFYAATWNSTNCNICQNDGFSTLISMVIMTILVL